MLDESFDAVVAIGQQMMAGTLEAICPYSCWHMTLGSGEKVKVGLAN